MRWVMSGGTFVRKRRRSDVMSSSLSTSTTCPMAAKAGTTTCSRDIQQKSAILRRGAHNLNLKSVNARRHAYSRQCGLTINRTGKQGQSVVVCVNVKPPAWEGQWQCSLLLLLFMRLRFLLYNYLPIKYAPHLHNVEPGTLELVLRSSVAAATPSPDFLDRAGVSVFARQKGCTRKLFLGLLACSGDASTHYGYVI